VLLPNRFAKSARYEKFVIKAASSNERLIIASIALRRNCAVSKTRSGADWPPLLNAVTYVAFQGHCSDLRG